MKPYLFQHGKLLYLCVFISSIFSVQVLSQEILWQKTFGGVHSEYLYDVKSTPDYGFLLAGSSFSNESGNKSEKGQGDLDYFLWKMDENGGVAGGLVEQAYQ